MYLFAWGLTSYGAAQTRRNVLGVANSVVASYPQKFTRENLLLTESAKNLPIKDFPLYSNYQGYVIHD